jgi:hypothetical protein
MLRIKKTPALCRRPITVPAARARHRTVLHSAGTVDAAGLTYYLGQTASKFLSRPGAPLTETPGRFAAEGWEPAAPCSSLRRSGQTG